MEEYIGKNLRVKLATSSIEGVMSSLDTEGGRMILDTPTSKLEIKFNDVFNVSLLEDEAIPAPLRESDMYLMFYEAFNVLGPFEDQFIYNIAYSLKKFFKEISTADIKIIVGSDDVFGRIGLCFARLVLNRAARLSVELRCEINDLRTLRYKNVFENSGGSYNCFMSDTAFSMVLFASNRNVKFDLGSLVTPQALLLDIPKTIGFSNFIGLGLGFIPENFSICGKFYYLIDVGFGAALAKKYKLPQQFKNSLIKVEVHKE